MYSSVMKHPLASHLSYQKASHAPFTVVITWVRPVTLAAPRHQLLGQTFAAQHSVYYLARPLSGVAPLCRLLDRGASSSDLGAYWLFAWCFQVFASFKQNKSIVINMHTSHKYLKDLIC